MIITEFLDLAALLVPERTAIAFEGQRYSYALWATGDSVGSVASTRKNTATRVLTQKRRQSIERGVRHYEKQKQGNR
jgi:hypothetical protein